MNNESDADRQEAKDAYTKYNRGLREIYRDNIKTFDNQILALSAGTLGLSLTFVSNLVNLQTALLMPLLIVSWVLLAAAVLSVLFGLRFATASKTIREALDGGKQLTGLGDYEKSGPDPKSATKRTKARDERIDLYNKLAFWFFVLGLATMVFFISVNVLSNDDTKGSVLALYMSLA